MPFPLWLFKFVPFGRRSEIAGARYLRNLGFRIVASPYRVKTGEIDIVAWDGDVLVFVEVKARRSDAPPEDNVGERKRQRVKSAARAYLSQYKLHQSSYRFDVLSVNELAGTNPEYRLMRDAFR